MESKMTLVNIDPHVGLDPKTCVSGLVNFLGESKGLSALCVSKTELVAVNSQDMYLTFLEKTFFRILKD